MAGLPQETEERLITADNLFRLMIREAIGKDELVGNPQSLIPVQSNAALAGKMICMKGKVYKMNDHTKERNKDLTEESSRRNDQMATNLARQLESDDQNEFTGSGTVPSPSGDSAAENKVATSLDNE